jgi:hypothetical protein
MLCKCIQLGLIHLAVAMTLAPISKGMALSTLIERAAMTSDAG